MWLKWFKCNTNATKTWHKMNPTIRGRKKKSPKKCNWNFRSSFLTINTSYHWPPGPKSLFLCSEATKRAIDIERERKRERGKKCKILPAVALLGLGLGFEFCSKKIWERDKEGIFAAAEALFHGAAGELLRSSYRRRERRHVGAHRRRRRQGAASDREEAAAPEEPADSGSG